MSSDYHLLCLSHDPAIVIGNEFRRHEVEALTRDTEALRDHPHCDVVIGRFSYPLIEVGCLGMTMSGTRCKRLHRGVEWIDRDWLKLLLAATTPPNAVDPAILQPFVHGCWPLERLRKLRGELGFEAPEGERRDDLQQRHDRLVGAARYVLRESRNAKSYHPLLDLIGACRQTLLEALGEEETG